MSEIPEKYKANVDRIKSEGSLGLRVQKRHFIFCDEFEKRMKIQKKF